ncbi:MAG: hypothetical protein UY35_C0002G0041 [Candidatus Saccharibacteria bacterium GW2011_GWC2_48_9]|nr:MAG: hypothetical protein UY35_C0002G0041 [Candidatus Saccharibacteria bacterium GW2011_GWC2_48_9]
MTKTKKVLSTKTLVIASMVMSLLALLSLLLIYLTPLSPEMPAIADCGGGYSRSADGLVVVEETDARCIINDGRRPDGDTIHLIGIIVGGISAILNFAFLITILRRSL